jgi:glycosyltransferase involved in cell wall biosynthesis
VFWCSHSEDRKHPGDRRRFGWFLKQSKLVEVKRIDECDLIYFTIASDLSLINRYLENRISYKIKKQKFIFDFCDSLLNMSAISSTLRGVLYSFSKYKFPTISLKKKISNCIKLCDGVVVSSLEQQKLIKKINKNVHVIPDSFFQEFSVGENQVGNNEVNLLWEGLSSGNRDLFERCAQIAKLVAERSQRSVTVNFITDLDYYLISNKYFKAKTHNILTSIFKDFTVDFTLTRWTESNLQRMIVQSDVAIIPIGDDPVMRGKPENKMILFMTAGIPVIASNTPAYDRVARLIDLHCTADTKEKFADLICGLLDNKNLSRTHIQKGQKFVFETRSESVLQQKWQDLIISVF